MAASSRRYGVWPTDWGVHGKVETEVEAAAGGQERMTSRARAAAAVSAMGAGEAADGGAAAGGTSCWWTWGRWSCWVGRCRGLAPVRLQQEPSEWAYCFLRLMLEACVALATVCPGEVARGAWGPVRFGAGAPSGCSPGGEGGSGGEGGGGCARSPGEGGGEGAGSAAGSCMWPLATLAALADCIGEGHEATHRALRVLVEWGTECWRQGRPVGPSDEQRRLLAQGAEHCVAGTGDDTVHLDVLLMPSLCHLRVLLRTCGNLKCVVLSPPGQIEAEAAAEAEAGGRLEACPGGCGAAWYCCGGCREEHWREGHGQLRCARAGQQLGLEDGQQ